MAPDQPTPAEENRRAKIVLGRDSLTSMFALPDGYRVTALFPLYDPYGIAVVVESPDLEPQPQDAVLPILGGRWSLARLYLGDELPGASAAIDGIVGVPVQAGQTWYRWAWQPEAVAPEPDELDEAMPALLAGHEATSGRHYCDRDECTRYLERDPLRFPDFSRDSWVCYFDPTEGEAGAWILLCPDHRGLSGPLAPDVAGLKADRDHLAAQIEDLARFITEHVPGEPSQSQGAVGTAIRLLGEDRSMARLRRLARGYFKDGGFNDTRGKVLWNAAALLDEQPEPLEQDPVTAAEQVLRQAVRDVADAQALLQQARAQAPSEGAAHSPSEEGPADGAS